ncbi:MAG: hypothetical protein J6B68_01910 [Lachnospiraceae bacterium]|nr:hypothetical protein [Lachnospiraceae bacterium]MBP3477603.1 hypothetical protein [Lachnospiraceae bacterium]
MLGRTNAVYAESTETASLSFESESILTPSSSDIWKIEYINNVYFVFLDNFSVLFGTDISSLKILQKEGSNLLATHVVYKDETYAFISTSVTLSSSGTQYFNVYISTDLIDFDVITISNNILKGTDLFGIFLSSTKKIIVMTQRCLGIFDSFNEMKEGTASIVEFTYISINSTKDSKNQKRKTRILNDRIFTGYDGDSSPYVITLDGNKETIVDQPAIIHGKFYFCNSTYPSTTIIYYSLNGVDYLKIAEVDIFFKSIELVEYEDGAIGILAKTNDTYGFALVEANSEISNALSNLVDGKGIIGTINCFCNVGMYTYLGCTGGVIMKTWVDYSGKGNTPNVTVLKTLSAKQALNESKSYTNEQIAALEERVAALEALTTISTE